MKNVGLRKFWIAFLPILGWAVGCDQSENSSSVKSIDTANTRHADEVVLVRTNEGDFRQISSDQWVHLYSTTSTRCDAYLNFCTAERADFKVNYKEERRDPWSIYLVNSDTDTRLQMDLHRHKIVSQNQVAGIDEDKYEIQNYLKKVQCQGDLTFDGTTLKDENDLPCTSILGNLTVSYGFASNSGLYNITEITGKLIFAGKYGVNDKNGIKFFDQSWESLIRTIAFSRVEADMFRNPEPNRLIDVQKVVDSVLLTTLERLQAAGINTNTSQGIGVSSHPEIGVSPISQQQVRPSEVIRRDCISLGGSSDSSEPFCSLPSDFSEECITLGGSWDSTISACIF